MAATHFFKTILFAWFVFTFVLTAASQTDPGIVYMSNFQRDPADPVNDDGPRIRRAIDEIQSGTVVFDEITTYTVATTIDLKPYITLQGSSFNTLLGYPTSPSHIRLTATGIPLFRIDDEFAVGISIRDLGLSATSSVGTIGFKAEGDTGNSITFVEFRNVEFFGFHYGIAAIDQLRPGTTSNWQFDNVKVEHSSFIVPETAGEEPNISNRHAAIFVDSANSGWRIDSSTMLIGKHSVGLYFERVAYTAINSLIANGIEPLQQLAELDIDLMAHSAIYVKEHGSLKVTNSVSEGVYYDLLAQSNSPFPINLISNTFQANVDVSGSVVNSIGNQFGVEVPFQGSPDGVFSSPLPVAKNNSFVYSMGDRFCMGLVPSRCDTAKWSIDVTSKTVAFGMNSNEFDKPLILRNYAESKFPIDFTNSETISRPMLSILSPTGATRNLLRLGNIYTDGSNVAHPFHYTLSRDQNNGYLRFEGNQEPPYTGYDFNGPIKLPTYTLSNLPASQGNGSLAFCSDCNPNSTPCTGSGGGALAMTLGYNWVCK